MLQSPSNETNLQQYGYIINLVIKDKSYTQNLDGIRMVSSISTPYQFFELHLMLDANDLIIEDVMGNEKIKISFKFKGPVSTTQLEQIDMELQYISSTGYTPPKNVNSRTTQIIRTPITIYAVCRKPYKAMTTIINKVINEKTPKQVIEECASETGVELIYDSDGENTEQIEQLLLPPMTFYKVITTLDNNYGLFDGASNLGFCQYDNKLYIQNLTKQIKKNQKFTIWQLGEDSKKNTEIIKKCNAGGSDFYIKDTVGTNYRGSEVISSISKKIIYTVKPYDVLYENLEETIDSAFFENHGIISKNSQYKLDDNLDKSRERYVQSHSGNEHSKIFEHAKIARKICDLATITVNIPNGFPILNFTQIGFPVKFKPATQEYVNLAEKYILKSSDLHFSKATAYWASGATLVLMRTNQYI